ncbi:hypothetical protein, partial [Klebsiella oxytoca]
EEALETPLSREALADIAHVSVRQLERLFRDGLGTGLHRHSLDLRLDQEANARCVRGVAGPIQAAGHPRVLVIPTNEE